MINTVHISAMLLAAAASSSIQQSGRADALPPGLIIDPAMVAKFAQPKLLPPPLPAHLKAARLIVGPHDLSGYRILNTKTGSVFFVYFDEAGRKAALRHIGTLDDMISQVARLALVDPATVQWDAVAFTQASAHGTSQHSADLRWQVQVDEKGELTAEGEDHFFNTVPHEQVHAAQKSQQSPLPRWFTEGHASWVGLKVTRQLRPQLAKEWRARVLAAAKAEGPQDLTGWGGVRVSSDVIRRQLSPEEQARMAKDPTYIPNRSFHFNVNEAASDETKTVSRYGASLALFEALEQKVGLAAMNKWVAAAWANPVAPHWTVLASLAKQHIGQDLTPQLKSAS